MAEALTNDFKPLAFALFVMIVLFTLAISVYFSRRVRTAGHYYVAGGGVKWFVNGVAFAGDYLSAASFLGVAGLIAFCGYDGFIYGIGFLAGWIVALFLIAEPLRVMGKYTFADALVSKFKSKRVRLAAAISTLIVSVFYLIPQMVGAGTIIQPLIGLPYWAGSGPGGRHRDPHRGHGGHGIDHLGAVHQRTAAAHRRCGADDRSAGDRWVRSPGFHQLLHPERFGLS